MSNHCETCSRRTDGANGRKLSRYLTFRLSFFCICGSRGSARIERLPSARERSSIPAVTHVDYSARVQTVHRETNPLYHDLISRFHALTGCPVLINTSFNVRSEPIVCTPEDAFRCFMGTDIDLLVVGNAVLHKQDQDQNLRVDYKDDFEMD